MKTTVVRVMVLLAVLAGCSETTTATVADASDVVDVVALSDVVDASRPDAPSSDEPSTDVAADAGTHCAASETSCSAVDAGVCVDLRVDRRHCGACGRACCPGEVCASGSCVVSCSPGITACAPTGGVCLICADITTSTAHCGACNRGCAAGQACVRGECVAPACAPVTEAPMPMGVCDGRGRIACEMWAQSIGGGRANATAQCLTSPSGCAKADHCDDLGDASTCRCGAEPACGPNQLCALVGPTARCQCAQP